MAPAIAQDSVIGMFDIYLDPYDRTLERALAVIIPVEINIADSAYLVYRFYRCEWHGHEAFVVGNSAHALAPGEKPPAWPIHIGVRDLAVVVPGVHVQGLGDVSLVGGAYQVFGEILGFLERWHEDADQQCNDRRLPPAVR